jgi:phenylacetate-CoA ligase
VNLFQRAILRVTPAALQNFALSAWGYQIHHFRYTSCFYRRLAELEKTATAPLEQLHEVQRERLNQRVEWARHHVPYYRDLPPPSIKRDPVTAIQETLASIPPMEKSEYANDPKQFMGENYPRWKLIKNNTSGTTGTALEFLHTREALAEEYATVWRMYRHHGIKLHDPRLSFGGNIVVPFEVDSPPFWRANYYGRQTLFSTYHMKPENLGIYVSAIHKMEARWVQGYPSSLYVMARALLDAGRPLPRGRLIGVFTSSERLLAFHRDVIEAGFSAPVVDRYGTSEFAVSMISCEKNRLHVDMEFGIVEVDPIERSDEVVRGSLLVTGLAPDAIPFFRYRIGDIGTRCNHPCPCGRPGETFLDVEGREDDFVMTPDGRLVGRLDHIFKGQAHIAEAQILQDRKEAIRVLVIPHLRYGKAAERRLMRSIRDRLGEEIEVEIETVNEITREPNGKFRAVKSSVGNLHSATV